MENNEKPKTATAINRRKNEWKYAVKRKRIRDFTFRYSRAPSFQAEKELNKPLHYYSKNPPWNGYAFAPNKTNNKGSRRYISKNYAPQKNWNVHDKQQIDDYENQVEELFDFD